MQDLDKEGEISPLFALESLQKLLNCLDVHALFLANSASDFNLGDEHTLRRRRHADRWRPDLLCMGAEDLTSLHSSKEVQRGDTLFVSGQLPPVAEHAIVVGVAIADHSGDLFS